MNKKYQDFARMLMVMPSVLESMRIEVKASKLFVEDINSKTELSPLDYDMLSRNKKYLKESTKILNIIDSFGRGATR